ncbi:isochorismatase family protein [Ancylobacter sp. G4_0304]|uniref:isochorismatase family protein n=1 Tax=Ancylobacter sp. G4_0304 TaxID=3114289 RepID=UPI0039C6C545
MKPNYPPNSAALYADTETPVLPKMEMTLDLARTALVVIDPQVDVMSPKGLAWPAVGESVTENNLVPNLVELFTAAKQSGITVAVSPHYYYCWDHHWRWQAPLEKFQHDVGAFDRKGPYTVEGFRASGADFMEEFKPFIEDGKTIICSPHKLYGPQANDLKLQLGKQGINQVILAGMLANMCVESHMRDLLEAGFEVAVVRDAVAAPKLPDGDGYLAALINFRFMANAVWSTDETVHRLTGRV